jgi:hypothetical protein
MNRPETKEPPKADLPKASVAAAPAHVNPPANPPPVVAAVAPEMAPVDPKSQRDLAAQFAPPSAPFPVSPIEPGMSVKEQRRAVRAARGSRDDLADNCYEALDAVRVPNDDGSGKSFEQLRAETGLSEEDLHAALDQLEGQNLVEHSVAYGTTLVYHARPGIPATPTLVIP